MATNPTWRGEGRPGVCVGDRQRDVDDGIERAASVGGGQRRHPLHDGSARSLAAVLGVDRHGDLDAVEVVPQRDLHHPHPENGPPGLSRGGEQIEPAVIPTVPGKRPDVPQAEAGSVRPDIPLDGVQHAVPLGDGVLVGGIDLPDLHPLTMPRRRRDGRCHMARAGRDDQPSAPGPGIRIWFTRDPVAGTKDPCCHSIRR